MGLNGVFGWVLGVGFKVRLGLGVRVERRVEWGLKILKTFKLE